MIRTLKRLAKHSGIAMVGGVVCSVLSSILLATAITGIGTGRLIRGHSLEVWYGPIIWFPGLVLGFLVNRRTLHRAACFVWLPGLLWLAYGMLGEATSWRPAGMSPMTHVKVELFPTTHSDYDSCASSECLGTLFCTWPALNSVSYSIGAVLALLSKRDKGTAAEPTTDYTTLGLDDRAR